MKRIHLACLLIFGCPQSPLFAADALAPVSEVRFSLLYSHKNNVQAHRYHDLENHGFLLDTGFRVGADTDLGWFDIDAKNLGLGTREVLFRLEMPNAFTLKLDYDESVYNEDHSGRTPFMGSSLLRLPTNWQPGVNTQSFDPDLARQDNLLGVRRRHLDTQLKYEFSPQLWSSLLVSLEARRGKRLQGTAIYFNAANPQAAMLPISIDEDTASVEWQTGFNWQALDGFFTYRLTDFDNQVSATRWQNPFATGLGAQVDYPAGVGEVGGDPGYRQHFARLGASYRVNQTIKLVFDGATSETRQTGRLAGYTANPTLTVQQPPPVLRLDAPLNTYNLNLIAYLQPLPRLGLNLRYKFEARENNARRYPWRYIPGDGIDQPPEQFAVFNKPLEFEQESLTATSTLRLIKGSRLELVYGIKRMYRKFAAVEDTEEEHMGVTYRFSQGAWQHQLGVDYRNKAGSTYEWSRSFYQLLSVNLINQIPDDQRWINHPALRQFHIANRQQREAQYRGTWQASDIWQLQITLMRQLTTFDKSDLGLRDDNTGSGNLALLWAPGSELSASAYLDYRRQSRIQRGRAFSGGIEKPANQVSGPLSQGSDPTRNYDLKEVSKAVSLGLELNWLQHENLEFSTRYALNLASIDLSQDTLVAQTPLPDIETILHSLETSASWRYSSRLQITGGHAYYRYEDVDHAVTGASLGTLAKVLTTHPRSPNEAIHTLSLSISYDL